MAENSQIHQKTCSREIALFVQFLHFPKFFSKLRLELRPNKNKSLFQQSRQCNSKIRLHKMCGLILINIDCKDKMICKMTAPRVYKYTEKSDKTIPIVEIPAFFVS